ncbi:MAG: SGNH/GDSL hydrolase family protein [Alteromonadaceae bacterium]|jgi:hypothetical protein|tara:strand:+ start:16071 stop:16628 length:558 start_codon:yes stop_codon:yes gene_type:complete
MFDIVMIGSSIFEFWGKPNWGKVTIANHAIRGTQSQDWLCKAIQGQLDNLPPSNHLLIYCGSNDLIFGHSPIEIVNNICSLLDKLDLIFPDTRLGYFSILMCPQKLAAGQQGAVNEINQSIKEYCYGKYDYFHFNNYIENNAKWFVEDGLHLTNQAYLMLNDKLNPVLTQWVKSDKIIDHLLITG